MAISMTETNSLLNDRLLHLSELRKFISQFIVLCRGRTVPQDEHFAALLNKLRKESGLGAKHDITSFSRICAKSTRVFY